MSARIKKPRHRVSPSVDMEDKKQHKTFLKEEDKKRGKPTTNPNKTTAERGCTAFY
jgi:hypothetical protein